MISKSLKYPVYSDCYFFTEENRLFNPATVGTYVTPQTNFIFANLAGYVTSKRTVFGGDINPVNTPIAFYNQLLCDWIDAIYLWVGAVGLE